MQTYLSLSICSIFDIVASKTDGVRKRTWSVGGRRCQACSPKGDIDQTETHVDQNYHLRVAYKIRYLSICHTALYAGSVILILVMLVLFQTQHLIRKVQKKLVEYHIPTTSKCV